MHSVFPPTTHIFWKTNILTEDSNFNFTRHLLVATPHLSHQTPPTQFGASELSDITGYLELPDGKAMSLSRRGGWCSDGIPRAMLPRFPRFPPGFPSLVWRVSLACCRLRQVVTGSECAAMWSDWTPLIDGGEKIKDISSDFPNTTQSAFDEVKFTFCGVCKTSSNVATAGWSYDKPWKKAMEAIWPWQIGNVVWASKPLFFTWKLS